MESREEAGSGSLGSIGSIGVVGSIGSIGSIGTTGSLSGSRRIKIKEQIRTRYNVQSLLTIEPH